ncbi:MAG: 1,4-alpha-glucan branching protein GlgB [Acidobacteria bacterium]|nr:1,4-alpha-glucan branching protein GlgB [Acidobacteriota bacterium]
MEFEVKRILRGQHSDPFHILGAHPAHPDGKSGVVVRAFLPQAEKVSVLRAEHRNDPVPMERFHAEGFFEAFIPGKEEVFPYRLQVTTAAGKTSIVEDPYRFPPVLSDFDLHLINEGKHQRLYEKLGTHTCDVNGIAGVRFAVWAPNAAGVSVTGDFNDWDDRRHPMRSRGLSGVWELFIPGLREGEHYKYAVRARSGGPPQLKSDPVGSYAEVRPKTASIVYSLDRYKWKDGDWMARRAARDTLAEPMSIYELHLGSWDRIGDEGNRFLTYRELGARLVPYVKDLGFTHIELLPVMEHPFDGSWGYQTVGYFAPTSRFGAPEDFMYLVDCCHQAGLGVILDWVPGHFPNDWHGLMQFDGTCLYEHADPRKGQHPEWGTLIFNYGRNEVRGFLLSNALYWLDKYHADGLRVDGVASMLYLDYSRSAGEWIPNQFGGRENLEAISFLQQLNTLVHERPGVFTAAEESTSWPGVARPVHLGGLGFTFKWNMGWMHDMLEYMSKDAIYRKHHHNLLTFVMLYAFHENFILPLSHDEVVHGKGSLRNKMPGDEWQKFANLRLLYGMMFGQPGKKLLFMGDEFGQGNEWNEKQALDWWVCQFEHHRRLREYVKDLNRLYRSQPALYELDFSPAGFEWIDFHDWELSTLCFLRRAKNPDDFIVFACNFTPVPRHDYRVGVPQGGYYRELLNSDSELYGGSNLGNVGGVPALAEPWHGRPYSLRLTLPPLSVVVLKRA